MTASATGTVDRWRNQRGEGFRRICWSAPEDADTLILIHHGLGEHAGRYDRFVTHLEGLSAHVWGFDMRGHGESDGKRGDADGLGELAGDLQELTAALMAQTGATKLVYVAHSLGAAVVTWALTQGPPPAGLVAVVLSAPPLEVTMTPVMHVKVTVGRLLNKIVPRLLMSNELDPAHISSVPAEVDRYLADPMVHDRLSVRLGLGILRGGEQVLRDAARLTTPMLIVHGTDDGISAIGGSRRLVAAAGSADKTLMELPGLRHETHHEAPAVVARNLAAVREWIGERIG